MIRKNRLVFPEDSCKGYYINFEISGKGKVFEVEAPVVEVW